MRYLIASDIHGSKLYCGKLLEAFRREEADKMILLGDILYHGPRNDLPEGYAPKEVIAMLNPLKDRILCVRGNCEAEVDQMVLEFPVLADYAIMDLGKRQMFITHGHVFNKDKLPPLSHGDILLCGHTHVVCLEENEGYVYMNPGSVSIPKEGTHRGYILLEDGVFTWKDLDGNPSLTYSI